MDEEERIEEMQKKQLEQQKELEKIKKKALNEILTSNARERLNRVKLTNPDLVNQIETYLVRLYQTGQIKRKINESQLKKILRESREKKDWKIKRK